MLNLKQESNIILLIGILSYLYLYLSLLNKKFNTIFIYFITLFIGYFIIGKKIFIFNILIIILDIFKNMLILTEGMNKNKNKDKDKKAIATKNAVKATEKQKSSGKKFKISKKDSKKFASQANTLIE